MSLRKYAKRLGKKIRRQVKASGRQLGKYHARALGVVLPIAGSLVAGPAGAALGTSIAYAGGRYWYGAYARGQGMHGRDAREWARNRAKQALIIGGAVTGASLGLALAGGTPLYGSSIGAFSSTFGLGTPAAATQIPTMTAASGGSSVPGMTGGSALTGVLGQNLLAKPATSPNTPAYPGEGMTDDQWAAYQMGQQGTPMPSGATDDAWAAYRMGTNQTAVPGAAGAGSFGKDVVLLASGAAVKALESTSKNSVEAKDPMGSGQTGGGWLTDLFGPGGQEGGAGADGGGLLLLGLGAVVLLALGKK